MNKTAKDLAHSVSLWLAIVVAFPLFFASCKDTDDKDGDAVPLDDAVLIDEDVDAPPVGDELKVMTSGRAYVVPGDYIYSGGSHQPLEGPRSCGGCHRKDLRIKKSFKLKFIPNDEPQAYRVYSVDFSQSVPVTLVTNAQ